MAGRDEKADYRLAFSAGAYGSVKFGRTADGREPAWEFWQQMSVKQQAAFGTLFGMISNDSRLYITNRQKFKQIEGDLYAFKANTHQMRIFCFRHLNTWYVTSVFAEKKEDEIPPGEVQRAQKIMADCKAELLRFEAARARVGNVQRWRS